MCCVVGQKQHRPIVDIVAGGAAASLSWLRMNVATGELAPHRSCTIPEAGVADIGIRHDGRILASACWDGTVRVYHARHAKCLAVLKHHQRAAAAVAFQQGTGLLASAGRDGTVALWSIYCNAAAEAP